MQRALIAGLAVAAVCAVIGVFIVQRGLAFLGDGLAHAAFGGIAIGLFLGASVENAVWIAIPFTGVDRARHRLRAAPHAAARRRRDRRVLLVLASRSACCSSGCAPRRDRQIDVESLLFGNMLVVTPEVLNVVVIVADRSALVAHARCCGRGSRTRSSIPSSPRSPACRSRCSSTVLLVETAVVVVVAVKTVGVVLVSSFVVIPAATRAARRLDAGAHDRCSRSLIGTVGSVVGLIASFHLNTPTAATIILIHSAGFAGALLWARIRR